MRLLWKNTYGEISEFVREKKITYIIHKYLPTYILLITCYFNLTVHFQNWSLELSLKITWSSRLVFFQDIKNESAFPLSCLDLLIFWTFVCKSGCSTDNLAHFTLLTMSKRK